jgi:hypothetical protein
MTIVDILKKPNAKSPEKLDAVGVIYNITHIRNGGKMKRNVPIICFTK